MKTKTTTSYPRLLCRLVRFFHADLPLAKSWARRHVDSCPDCARFYAAVTALDRELAQQTPGGPDSIPAGLEDRIWATVEADRSAQVRPTRSIAITRWAGAFAAVAVLVLAGLWFVPSTPTDSAAVAVSPEFDQQDIQTMVVQLEEFSAKWLVLAEPEAEAAVDNQLNEEWGALEADANAALDFLRRSFVPSGSSAS